MSNPYGDMANTYARAGWAGVVPLAGKAPAVPGLTGYSGVDPDDALRGQFIQFYTANNIGLRMPVGVVGVDIDHYEGKTGADTLLELTRKAGSVLPATWSSTSRGPGQSRILFFRAHAPSGRKWRNQKHIEVIHRGHRHAVVWPSVHPNTGRLYQWYLPTGEPAHPGQFPRFTDLAEMPQEWMVALSEPDDPRLADDVQNWLRQARDGEPCTIVSDRLGAALEALGKGAPKHETVRDTQLSLVSLAAAGHRGVYDSLRRLQSALLDLDSRPEREAAWSRALTGAVSMVMAEHDAPGQKCTCETSTIFSEMIDHLAAEQERQRQRFSMFMDPPAVLDDESLAPAPPRVTPEGDPVGGPMAKFFLTPAQMRELKPPAPLIDKLLYRGTLAWMVGQPGTFKSFVVLDMMAHLAEGRDWLGHRVPAPVGVAYLVLEGSGGVSKRIKAWEKHHGRPMSQEIRFWPYPYNLADDAAINALKTYLAETKPGVLVIDTQAQAAFAFDENDNSSMSQMIENIKSLVQVTASYGDDPQSAVTGLVVHHEAKAGGSRGASAIHGAQDTQLALVRENPDTLNVGLEIRKQKDGEAGGAPMLMTMVPVDIGVDEFDIQQTSLVVGPYVEDAQALPGVRREALKQQIMKYVTENTPEGGALRGRIEMVMITKYGFRDKADFDAVWDDITSPKVGDQDYVPPLAQVEGTQRWVPRVHHEGIREGGHHDMNPKGV